MKYNEVPPVKIGKPYNVSKQIFNKHFESFASTYKGDIPEMWRAFEITYLNEGINAFKSVKVEKKIEKKKKSYFDKEKFSEEE